MPTEVLGWGAYSPEEPLRSVKFNRRDVGPEDVSIKIAYCGVCHSDVHKIQTGGGKVPYPLVPGHEIVGQVTAVGNKVTKYKVGDTVGVGCLVDSCLSCNSCRHHLEQYCHHSKLTYGAPCTDGTGAITQGGYSDHIVVRESFVLRIPDGLDLAAAAPLLCAGITTYSPLRHWGVKQGSKVGVVGLGGLGHMAVKLARAMGAEVTVFTTSQSKVDDAKRLGANHVVISKDEAQMKAAADTLDLIIDTVGVSHDLPPYLETLAVNGTLVLIGLSDKPNPEYSSYSLIRSRRSVAGSLIGGLEETQEMLDFCAKHNITSDIEMIKMDYINEAFKRMLKNDVKYRFVIDMATLQN